MSNIHPKVQAAAVGASAGTIVGEFAEWGVEHLFFDGSSAPAPVTAFVLLVAAGVCSLAAGYIKRAEQGD